MKILYVHLINDTSDLCDHGTLPSIPLVQGIRSYITDFYTSASHVSKLIDVRFLLSNISSRSHVMAPKPHCLRHGYEVILTDIGSENHSKLQSYIASAFPNKIQNGSALYGVDGFTDGMITADRSGEKVESYDYVVLGGTFDRLHVGHKILLSEGCILCDKALTVGITDGDMVNKKILPELMQPIAARIQDVNDFLFDVKPNIEYRVTPITDIFGPTITDPSLQCLVVSDETVRSWDLINDRRRSLGMNDLRLDIIHLVPDFDRAADEEEKVSSSSARIRSLGTLLKSPKPSYARRPFVIGLTGGTASGKSSIGRRLAKLGAGIVDCDALGHQSYQPGTPTFQLIVDTFGAHVVDSSGQIDRKILGSMVFGNREMMGRLNAIVWPAIRQLATEEVALFAERGVDVVVLDAAILLEAGWDAMVDEVWVAVIPKEETVKRLMERNRLTEEEAQKRLDLQITNKDRVSKADVVLCTFWEPEVTQKQVEKAWTLLHDRLGSRKSKS